MSTRRLSKSSIKQVACIVQLEPCLVDWNDGSRIVCSALLYQLKQFFKSRLKQSKLASVCRSVDGRAFDRRGPVAEKLLSPKRFLVRGTSHVKMLAERSWRPSESDTRWHSSVRWTGPWPVKDWKTSWWPLSRRIAAQVASAADTTLHGVMWSLRRAPVTRRAAAFYTDCMCCISRSVMPYSREVQ